jgi:ankyrin repeat protein
MDIDSFKEEFQNNNNNVDLFDIFKLPTPQTFFNPFEVNTTTTTQLDNNHMSNIAMQRQTPEQTFPNLFHQENANSQQAPIRKQEQNNEAMEPNSVLSNQMLDVVSASSFKNVISEDDVQSFIEGLDSSTFSISPWGMSAGYNVPSPPKYTPTPFPQVVQQQKLLQSNQPGDINNPQQAQNNASQQIFIPSPTSCYPATAIFSNNTAYSPQHNFSGSPTVPPVNLIKLVEGFNKPLKDKQIGGKDNIRHTIPTQVIELAVNRLPPNSDPSVLSVRACVLGYDRVSRSRVILGQISEKGFEEKGKAPNSRWLCTFDDLVIQFSSHNNGQKLALRFQLLDADKRIVCHVDSYEFETITKRGLEKIKERSKRKRSDSVEAEVEYCDPSMGLTTGGQLVKIIGKGFVCAPGSQAIVRFGELDSKEIHSVKRNCIVCETPEGQPGKVDVNVIIDKKNALPSSATFEYIHPNDKERIQEMIKHFSKHGQYEFEDVGGRSKKPRTNNLSSTKNSNVENMYAWALGNETDSYGFNMLHHACARGFFELAYFLVQSKFCDINALDNYGRSALFWAMWSKSTRIAAYLISKGADMTISDDVNDTFLHMMNYTSQASGQENIQHVKYLLFWMLKFDDEYRTQARFLSEILKQKNDDGLTVIEAAIENGNIILGNLLNAIVQLCASSIQQNIIALSNIKFRSGEFNGKQIKDIYSDPNIKLSFELTRDNYIIIAQLGSTQLIRSVISNTNIAYLIFDMKGLTAEFTLQQAPLVEIFQDDEWKVYSNCIALNSLAFSLELANVEGLKRIYNYTLQLKHLNQFQEFSFHYQAPINEQSKVNKLKSEAYETNSTSVKEEDKMHVLRMKFSHVSLNKTPARDNVTDIEQKVTSI